MTSHPQAALAHLGAWLQLGDDVADDRCHSAFVDSGYCIDAPEFMPAGGWKRYWDGDEGHTMEGLVLR